MVNILEIIKKNFLILLLTLFTSCSLSPKYYNVYKVNYEVLYPTKTVDKTCIIKGEVETGCFTTGFFGGGPLIYYISGEFDNMIKDSYPINVVKIEKIKTIKYY